AGDHHDDVAGPGTVGRVAVVPPTGEAVVYSPQLCYFRVLDHAKIDQRFLRYWFSSQEFWDQASYRMNNTDMAAYINMADIRSLKISLPRPSDQQRIAEVLGALDDKIVANTKLSRTIDQFLAAYYSRITKNSPTVPLGEIASVNPETCKPLVGGSLRYIDISSVGPGSYEFPEITSWDDAPSRARRQVRSGDTLWSTVRPNRRSHALNLSSDELLVGSTGLAVLRPYGIGYSYLYESTKTPEFSAYLENVAEGSAYPAVRANRFEDAPISWPESAARDSFEMAADPLRKMQHSNEVENQYLAALRDTLIPQLMSGKLRVKDAETLVESVV
ncbi:MAG: restriction endonuclease subunit S, partial [Glutamicibacter arilaitensis]|uniref:restriction endonuclease subunit S n=1 Tax=Glutamicibacter arilaitensis TaxID=256701 RepID=UPI003FB72CAE